MGQRSEIYVKYNGKIIVANYYPWNYSERMISRARHGIEWFIRNTSNYDVSQCESFMQSFKRIFDVNFDMVDIINSRDLIAANEGFFSPGSLNDGALFIDISNNNKTIKYAFMNNDFDSDHIMTPEQYMDWETESCYDEYKDWRNEPYIPDEQAAHLYDNIAEIYKMAQLMTKEEVKDFMAEQPLF